MAQCKSCGCEIPLGKDYCDAECYRARFEALRRRVPERGELEDVSKYYRPCRVIR